MSSPCPDRVRHRTGARVAPAALAALLAPMLVIGACEQEARPAGERPLPSAPGAAGRVFTSAIAAGPERPAGTLAMPFVPNAYVLAEGRRLFQWMNCAGCHGLRGGGGMGPPFADGRWIYGGEPGTLYQSIVQGRPDGMPAFASLSEDQVWKLVAYVRSLAPETDDAAADDAAPTGDAASPDTARGGARDRDRSDGTR